MKWFLLIWVVHYYGYYNGPPVAILEYDTEAECQEARPVPTFDGWVSAACIKQTILKPIILGPGPD